MKISTITGHLTATNKTHIKSLLDAGIKLGKVDGISYKLTKIGQSYHVFVVSIDKSDSSGFNRSSATFDIN